MTGRDGFRAVAPVVAASVVRAVGATLRVTTAGLDGVIPHWRARRPLIYAMWHGRMLLAPWLNDALRRSHGARLATVLASRSADGEIVARYAGRFGLGVVRGSSSRGGVAALRALVGALEAGQDVVIVPDGPRGPSGRLQPGVVALASLADAPIVPLGISARPARRLGTWDAFLVPLPFARVAAVFGAPLTIRRDADRERAGKDVQAALDEVTTAADRLVAR